MLNTKISILLVLNTVGLATTFLIFARKLSKHAVLLSIVIFRKLIISLIIPILYLMTTVLPLNFLTFGIHSDNFITFPNVYVYTLVHVSVRFCFSPVHVFSFRYLMSQLLHWMSLAPCINLPVFFGWFCFSRTMVYLYHVVFWALASVILIFSAITYFFLLTVKKGFFRLVNDRLLSTHFQFILSISIFHYSANEMESRQLNVILYTNITDTESFSYIEIIKCFKSA